MGRAAEVITVGGLLQPTVLAGRFAGPSARGLRAVALAPGATRVGIKDGLTVLALTFGAWTSHWPASPQANDQGIGARKKENGKEKARRRRSKKTEDGEKYHRWGRRRNGLTDNFTLAVYIQFLVAADTAPRFGVELPDMEASCTNMPLFLYMIPATMLFARLE